MEEQESYTFTSLDFFMLHKKVFDMKMEELFAEPSTYEDDPED